MPTYEVTGPDGKKYRVTGEGGKQEALAAIKRRVANEGYPREGSILPITKTGPGFMQNMEFNPNAGIPGAIWRGVSSVRDAYEGNIAPDEMVPRAMEAATLMSPASVATRAGVGVMGAPITKRSRPKPPTAAELFGEGDKLFKAMRESGVDYSSQAVRKWADDVINSLNREGMWDETAPATIKTLQRLLNPPKGSVANIDNLAALRRALTEIGMAGGTDGKAAREARAALDLFIARTPENGVVAGRAGDAARLLEEANANWSAGKRRGKIDQIIYDKELSASAANSGQNTGNSLRQGTKALLTANQGKRVAGFSPEEKAALEGVVKGTPAANITRSASNVLGGGGGLGSVVSGGAGSLPGFMLGSPTLATVGAFAAPVAGNVLKRGSNAMTRKALQQAGDLVSTRSPLFGKMQANAPVQLQGASPAMTVAQRAAMVKALGEQRQKLKESKAKNKVIKMKELDEEMRRLLLLRLPPNEA